MRHPFGADSGAGGLPYEISKSVSDGKTYTKVERLDTEGRIHEIARITGGLEVTELQLKSAEEMLKNAGNS